MGVVGDVLLGRDVDDYLAVLLAPLLGEAGAQNRNFTVLTGVQAVALLLEDVTAVLVVVILIDNGERRLICDVLSCRGGGIGSRRVSNGHVCGGGCILGQSRGHRQDHRARQYERATVAGRVEE